MIPKPYREAILSPTNDSTIFFASGFNYTDAIVV